MCWDVETVVCSICEFSSFSEELVKIFIVSSRILINISIITFFVLTKSFFGRFYMKRYRHEFVVSNKA